MFNATQIRRWKTVVVMAAMLSGATFVGGCGLTDIQKNIIAGTLDFVSGYTTDVLNGWSPTPIDLFE